MIVIDYITLNINLKQQKRGQRGREVTGEELFFPSDYSLANIGKRREFKKKSPFAAE